MEEFDLTTRRSFKHFRFRRSRRRNETENKEEMADLPNSRKDFLFEVDSVGINNLTLSRNYR